MLFAEARSIQKLQCEMATSMLTSTLRPDVFDATHQDMLFVGRGHFPRDSTRISKEGILHKTSRLRHLTSARVLEGLNGQNMVGISQHAMFGGDQIQYDDPDGNEDISTRSQSVLEEALSVNSLNRHFDPAGLDLPKNASRGLLSQRLCLCRTSLDIDQGRTWNVAVS